MHANSRSCKNHIPGRYRTELYAGSYRSQRQPSTQKPDLAINLKNALNSNCKVSFAIKIAGIENVTRSQFVYLPCTPAVEVVESSMERIGRIKPTVRINLWQ